MNDLLDTIIIENARTCNLRCRACPTVYAQGYPAGVMSRRVFERTIDHISPRLFPRCGLTGWGETFLDPRYFQRLAELKKRGYYVGSTTNLTLVDEERVRRLMDLGQDLLCISIDPFHLESAHRDLDEVLLRLDEALRPVGDTPGSLCVSLNVVVGRSRVDFITRLLDHIHALPVRSVSVIPLIMMPTRELRSELLSRNALEGMRRTFGLRYPAMQIGFAYLDEAPAGNCRSDVQRNVYVAYDGTVSPCCVLALEFPNHTFDGREHRTRRLALGNLAETDFQAIWNDTAYKAFRQGFRSGAVPSVCRCCNAWRSLPETLDEGP